MAAAELVSDGRSCAQSDSTVCLEPPIHKWQPLIGRFSKKFDPQWESVWIAERAGEIVGSVFLVRASATVAELRLLYVEPSNRGFGLGRRQVDQCIRFARTKGYKTLTLRTNDVLASARRIYETAGFRPVKQEQHHSFGKNLVGQTSDLAL